MMSRGTLEAIIRKALEESEGECTFAYQGGEPTLAGLDFFIQAIELQKKHNLKGLKISNLIQTNGYHIDDAWAEFFAANHFLAGVSLDGTKDTHDAFRKTNANEASFKNVMESINTLKTHRVDFNILTVVNSQTARHIRKIYNFYKRQGFEYLQFIPCIPPFGKENAVEKFTLAPIAFGNFMCELFDLWYADIEKGGAPHIRQFENYIEMLLGYPPESCGMSGVCSNQLVIEADGQVYPCDFYVLDGYSLGNIHEVSFSEIAEKQQNSCFVRESASPHSNCRACKYFGLCRGGCKRYREPRTQSGYGLNILCEGYYRFFEHSFDRLALLAGRLKSRMG